MKTALLALLTTACALAGPIYTGTATLTGVNGASVDGSYTSPYYLTLNGQQYNVWCDDYPDHVSVGESWEVNVFSGDDQTGAYFAPDDYPLLFALVRDANLNPGAQIDIQQAIWSIEDSAYSIDAEAAQWITTARTETVDPSRFIIISGVNPNASDRTQEFIAMIHNPEPRSWLMITSGFVVLLLVRFNRARGVE